MEVMISLEAEELGEVGGLNDRYMVNGGVCRHPRLRKTLNELPSSYLHKSHQLFQMDLRQETHRQICDQVSTSEAKRLGLPTAP